MSGPIFEAIINGDEIDSYDPVTMITISTEFHEYHFHPSEVTDLQIRVMKSKDTA